MKPSLYTFRVFLPLVVFSFILLSCEESAPIGPEQLLITMKANHYGSCGGYRPNAKIVITDSQNHILAVKEVNGQMDMPIFAPAALSEETIDLYILDYTDGLHRITGFRGLKKGIEFMGYGVPENISQSGQVDVNTRNIPEYESVTLSSSPYGITLMNKLYKQSPQSRPTSVKLSYTANEVFVHLVQNGTGRYGFVDLPSVTGDIMLDYSQLHGVSEKRQIDLGQNVFSYGITINGALAGNASMNDSYTVYNGRYSLIEGGDFDRDIYYPNTFKKYFTTLNYAVGDKFFTETRSEIQPSLKYEPMKLDINLKNANLENFDLNVTGEYDYYELTYANFNSSIEFHIFGRQGDTAVRLPDFSHVRGLKSIPYHSLTGYGIKLYNLKSLQEDQSYFKYYSSPIDVRLTYDQQIVSFSGNL